MKKVFIIFGLMIIFNACSKKEEISENNLGVKNNFVVGFVNEINDEYEKTKNNQLKSINVGFSLNPYDGYGSTHNQYLEYLYQNGLIIGDLSELIKEIEKNSAIKFTNSEQFYRSMIIDLNNKVYFDDDNYNSELISSITNISHVEKTVINTYFDFLSQIGNVNARIVISKAAERFIINHGGFSDEVTKRILTTFALYRYSTYFWDKNNKLEGKAKQCDIIDAIGEYIVISNFNHGLTEVSHDVSKYAATFSAIWSNVIPIENQQINSPNWQLVDGNYYDPILHADGKLYVNIDDTSETYFGVRVSDAMAYDGTYNKVPNGNGGMIYSCSGAAENCYWSIQHDGNGNIIAAEIVCKSHIGIIFDPVWNLVDSMYHDPVLKVEGKLYKNADDGLEELFVVDARFHQNVTWQHTYKIINTQESQTVQCFGDPKDCNITALANGGLRIDTKTK